MNDIKQQSNRLQSLLHKDTPLNSEEISELKNNSILLIDMGYECVESGEYEEAYELFSMGRSINNTDPDILNGLGITLCEMGRYRESRDILKEAIKTEPHDAITLANLAGVCWETEDYDEAIYYYHMALKEDAQIEEIYFNLINLYIESDMLYVAYITALEFIKVFPDNIEAKELIDDILINLALSNL